MLAAQYGLALNNQKTLSAFARFEWLYLGKEYFDLANQISQDPNSVLNSRWDLGVHLADPQTWGTGLRIDFQIQGSAEPFDCKLS